jgi:hypothetical protein
MRELTSFELDAVSGGDGWRDDAIAGGATVIFGFIDVVASSVVLAGTATLAAALMPALALVGGIAAVGYGVYLFYEAMDEYAAEWEYNIWLYEHGGY